MPIRIEYDPGKDDINRRKHGVSLEVGARVIESAIDIGMDHHDAEIRWRAYGWWRGVPMVCVYTMRDSDCHRIISVRRASRREVTVWFVW
jgi:uncharacterized protein